MRPSRRQRSQVYSIHVSALRRVNEPRRRRGVQGAGRHSGLRAKPRWGIGGKAPGLGGQRPRGRGYGAPSRESRGFHLPSMPADSGKGGHGKLVFVHERLLEVSCRACRGISLSAGAGCRERADVDGCAEDRDGASAARPPASMARHYEGQGTTRRAGSQGDSTCRGRPRIVARAPTASSCSFTPAFT